MEGNSSQRDPGKPSGSDDRQGQQRIAELKELRERLLNLGAQALTDAEILGLLLRNGSIGRTQMDMARDLLAATDRDLGTLGRLSIADMMKIPGMGEARAMSLMAAMELGRRRMIDTARDRPWIRSSAEAYNEFRPKLMDLQYEQFWMLMLDRGNRLMRVLEVSDGGMHGTVADPKRIFRMALESRAASIVLAHNHPSGQLRPSEEDIHLTRKLSEGAKLLDIGVQDHLIVTAHGYYSFADQGQI